jgi:hypothetical protein
LVVAVLVIGLIFTQQILNTARFGNPFYPVRVLGLSGTEGRTLSPVQYIPRVPLLTNAASYLVSVTEVDPIIRSEAGFSFARSWHNHNSPKSAYRPEPLDYPFIVTGGSNGLLFLAVFAGAVLSLYGFWMMRDHLEMSPLLILKRRLFTVSLLFMFLPQSMELRYYMASLFVPAIVAVSSGPTALRLPMRWIVVLGLWFIMTVSYLQPLYFWARTGEWISARGLFSPDLYRNLPTAQQCVENPEPGGGPASTGYASGLGDMQPTIACYFRLTQPE